jgi:hypothetical protein
MSIFIVNWWGLPLILLALGELIYCVIRFAGDLGQDGSTTGLAFFTTIAALGIGFTVYLIAAFNRKPSLLLNLLVLSLPGK